MEGTIILGVILVVVFIIGLRSDRNRDVGDSLQFDSPIERRLYYALLSRGIEAKPQWRCGPYRVDLALPQYKIAIECDGKAYHSSPKQKAYDKKRSAYLYRHGFKSVLRFTGSQINRNPYKCADRVIRKIQSM